jgi:hypothetical protein
MGDKMMRMLYIIIMIGISEGKKYEKYKETGIILISQNEKIASSTQESPVQEKPNKNNIGIKTFIPGLPQLERKEEIKGLSIIFGEGFTFITGITTWYLSEREYDKYKKLPYGTPQEEFDRHINNSELYGTMAICSFVFFSGIYVYSVIDAILASGKDKKQALYFIPKKDGIILTGRIRF